MHFEDNIAQEPEKLEINPTKCYSCGKIFKRAQDLQRHKNRKTPCLIREVPDDQRSNPLRCIFCNKVLSKKEHLVRHLGICKIKNGGIGILDEHVRYEQEIRILKEQRETDAQRIEKLEKEKDLQIKLLTDRLDALEKNTNPGNMINSHNTTNINQTFNFYNYDKPKLDTLNIIQEDLLTESIVKKLIELVWFNKNIPENHSVLRPNIKEQRLLVHKDNAWENIIGEELSFIFASMKNNAYLIGIDKINSGSIYKTDDEFRNLYPVVQEAVKRFNIGEQITNEDIMQIITKHRDMVIATKNARNNFI